MTPSLGVTPDEAQLPEGPPAHRGGHIWAVLVLWARLSGEQILGLDLPGKWVLGLDLPLGGPLSLPLSSPIAVNISKKWKRQKKKKRKKKISSLEATGACGPASPGFLWSRTVLLGPGSQDFPCMCASPARWVAPRAAFYNPETKNLEATAKQRTCFLPGTLFCHLLPCST